MDGCTSTRVEEWRSKRVLSRYFDEAIRSLAFVEHCVPKIVSALEMLQSLVQIILKAVQGVAFPPNPFLVVDVLQTSRRTLKQSMSIYDVYKLQPELKKAVKVLSEFALKLVDAIARTAELLKNQPTCCACCMPAGGCCGGS